MNEYLEQIAKMLVSSASVPTDESDTADEEAIVRTVHLALSFLDVANSDRHTQHVEIESLRRELRSVEDETIRLAKELVVTNEQKDKFERDAMNWKTTTDALAQQRNELQAQYRGMSHAVQLMTEVFARID